jgi:hypothetical protein
MKEREREKAGRGAEWERNADAMSIRSVVGCKHTRCIYPRRILTTLP